MKRRVATFFLIALWGWLLLGRGSLPLAEPEEARYAEIPRQMLRHQNWVVPIFDGQPYLDKPPLLYWLVMTSLATLGTSLWAVRLIPTVVSLATVLVTWWWARRRAGPPAGILAAVVLLLTPNFVLYGPMLTMNGLLALCVTAALATGHEALRRSPLSCRWWLTSALCCGAGWLAKGPIALALVVPPLWILPHALRWPIRPGGAALFAYVGTAAAVFLPWLVAVTARQPQFLEHFFWRHHVERFLSPFDHGGPLWYYLPELFAGTLPWSLVLPAAWASLRRQGSGPSPDAVFALVAFLGMLLLFSLSGSKRHLYLVPLYPTLAVAAVITLADERSRRPDSLLNLGKHGRTAALVGTAVAVTSWALLGVPLHHRQFTVDDVLDSVRCRCDVRHVPVYCYPHPWPSIPFSLDRDDVVSLSLEHRQDLYRELQCCEQSLVFLKPSVAEAFLAHLPGPLRAEVVAENPRIIAVIIRG